WGGAGTIGPTADGRIKPDLCFWYDSIRTTYPTSTYTNSFGGTSAACPETAGHFGLFFQMWKDGIFGNPVSGGTVFQERPHSSTARAVMINTASQYPFSGTGADLTRVHQGWGRPDVANLYDLRDNLFVVDETDVLAEFQTRRYSTLITPGQPHNDILKATLTYNDLAGITNAGQHRVNDMTLKVTSPSGTVYYGNNGLLAGNWSTPGGSPNTIDTVENVFIQNPEQGLWSIDVTAAEINQDGHVETGALDMDYALVVSGGVTMADCNANGVVDPCETDCGLPGCNVPGCGQNPDCNGNQLPDECDIGIGVSADCNANSVPDECELAGNDCNADQIPDECQLAGNDCDGNQEPDDCDAQALAGTISSPANQTPCPGASASFSVTAPSATAYQWYHGAVALSNGGSISGAQSATLTIDPVAAGDEGAYRCEVSSGCISTMSGSGTLDLESDDLQVNFVTPSTLQICASGATFAGFEVAVNDTTGVTYQWSHDGQDLTDDGRITGANTKRIEINPPTGADIGSYTCTVTNACMATPVEATANLYVGAAFLEQPPATLCTEYGSDAVFTVVAADPQPDIFQWFEGAAALADGGRISGATTGTLTLSNVGAADDGRTFSVRIAVADPFCLNNSDVAVLHAAPAGACPSCPTPGDMDGDGDYDLYDYYRFTLCFGADVSLVSECACANVADSDTIVNISDWTAMQSLVAGPN
ncbi:MAG TPA: hypothetical protein P5572_14620, partial [Phycisphaerae bacterium]|nr:hypothetical protein [Phycisphaerae bacterium]